MLHAAVLAVLGTALVVGPAPAHADGRAPSLGPAPKKIGVLECTSIAQQNCIADVWEGRFEITMSPHVVRVGETMTARVSDGTDAYGHSWSWGDLPAGAKVISCSPPPNTWTKGPSTGVCTFRMTAAQERWTAASACVNPLGQTYCDEDYYAVLEDRYVLRGQIRDSAGGGVGGVKVTFDPRRGGTEYTTSRADGTYDAILRKGTYDVRAAKAGVRLCAVQRPRCENPTEVKLVTDKELDFGPPSGVVVQGRVADHRGKGLTRVTVEAVSTENGRRTTDTTDPSGAYRLELAAGAYNVRPVRSGRTDRERYLPEVLSFEQATGTIAKDFQLAPADAYDFETSASRLLGGLWWTTATASGAAAVQATATIENGRGDPVADEPVQIDAPYWDVAPAGSAAPEVITCDESWRQVYPGARFERPTDSQGEVHLTMFLGGTLGNFYLHSREARDVTVLDVERFGQTGRAGAVDHDDILLALKTNQGFGAAPTSARTPAQLQEGLLVWLLARRAGITGPGGQQTPIGEFAPITNAAGTIGAIVFYPSGDPLPLRAHLANGTPLPAGYETRVLRITGLGVLGAGTILAGLPTLEQWEQQAAVGRARYGHLAPRANQDKVYLGYPYPPVATDPLRDGFDRCVPGAAPGIVIERHSPVRLSFRDARGKRFDVDGAGRVRRNDLAGTYTRGKGSRPDAFILPSGSYTARITGTGAGRTTLVVRAPGRGGDDVKTYALRSRRGASGTLAVTSGGGARTMRFGGRRVRARQGVGLRVRGIPAAVRAGRAVTLRLRVRDDFGRAVAGAAVAVTGRGVSARGTTDASGRATVTFAAPAAGRVRARISSPGHATLTDTIRVRTAR